jgi:hypothetical protein
VTAEFLGVIPELTVPDVDASLAYYRDVLDFRIEGRHLGESGEVVFGSVLRGRTNIYMSRRNQPAARIYCWICVHEVDELCATFMAKGARSQRSPLTSHGATDSSPWRTSTDTPSPSSASATA